MRVVKTEEITANAGVFRVRWIIGGVILLNSMLQFVDRANISVVIPQIRLEMDLTYAQAGLAISAFFLGYLLTLTLGGWILRALGTRTAVFFSTIIYSVFTHLTGQAQTFEELLACRVGLGLGEGPIVVGLTTAVNDWFPPREKARASFLVYAAGSMAMMFVPPVIATLSLEMGWRMVFTLFAFPGYLLAVVWFLVMRSRPEEHPWMGQRELAEIRGEDGPPRPSHGASSIAGQFRSWTFLGITIAYALNMFFLFGLISWIPSYLLSLGFTQNQMGWLTSLFWVGLFLGTAFGSYLSDVIFRGKRRPPILLSNAAGALLQLLWISQSPAAQVSLVPIYLVIIGFFLSLGFTCYPAYVMAASAPADFPVLMGFVSGFSAVGGFFGPFVTGRLFDLFQSYSAAFGAFVLTNLIILVVVVLLREPRIHEKEKR
jgi:MFS family permease